MISFAQALPIGNAIRLVLSPSAGAVSWRVLRKSADTFTGHDDPDALVVVDGDETSTIDRQTVANGQTYYYRFYWHDGAQWNDAGSSVQVTPAATYREITDDALMLVRERIDLGLQEEVQRGNLRHRNGKIPCLTAFPWHQKNPWPVVTVHLSSDSSNGRAIGELMEPDSYDADAGTWQEAEGWFSSVQLDVIGWSQNPDERQELRQAIRRIVIGNLPVFDDAGLLQIDFRMIDQEEPGEQNTIVYKAVGSFSCLSPTQVAGDVDDVDDVISTARVSL